MSLEMGPLHHGLGQLSVPIIIWVTLITALLVTEPLARRPRAGLGARRGKGLLPVGHSAESGEDINGRMRQLVDRVDERHQLGVDGVNHRLVGANAVQLHKGGGNHGVDGWGDSRCRAESPHNFDQGGIVGGELAVCGSGVGNGATVVGPVGGSARAGILSVICSKHDDYNVPFSTGECRVLRAIPIWTISALQHRAAASTEIGDRVSAANHGLQLRWVCLGRPAAVGPGSDGVSHARDFDHTGCRGLLSTDHAHLILLKGLLRDVHVGRLNAVGVAVHTCGDEMAVQDGVIAPRMGLSSLCPKLSFSFSVKCPKADALARATATMKQTENTAIFVDRDHVLISAVQYYHGLDVKRAVW